MAHVDLKGCTALVTGGGTRVGAAIARALAGAGCDVVVHYASSAEGARAVATDVEAMGRRAFLLRGDLTDRSAIERVAEGALAATGRLDVLVHNAANFERVPPGELSAGSWDRALALNVTAPYLLTIALAPALRSARGSIVAITCLSASRPLEDYIPYSASKAALANLVAGLALGLAPDVRVNAVAPGAVLPPVDFDDAKLERLRGGVPLARLGAAEDVASAVVFLAQNDFITGHTITVDGGSSLRRPDVSEAPPGDRRTS